MSLTLTLDTHGERLVAEQLRRGVYRSAEEVVTRALETLADIEKPAALSRTMTPAEAVADIRELRRGLTLGCLTVRDLIDEGRKY